MNSAARIIDANFNRAREALRTIEDVARFHLDHLSLVNDAKNLRHQLTAAIASLPIDSLTRLANRDTQADVGTTLSTPAEMSRPTLRDVALAASGRLSEALRSLEESAKCLPQSSPAPSPAAAEFKAIRYAAYTLEKQVILALGTGLAVQWRLCILITESLCTHHSWEAVARAAVANGADCLQLREKSLDDAQLLARARFLTAIAHQANAAAIINDRPDIALLAGADGVHLGQTDLSIADTRKLAGANLLIGMSTENLEQAAKARADGADYCGVGPMFPTTTKVKPRLAGPAFLHEYLAATNPLPHLAIGGITPLNAIAVAAAGGRGVAVSSCVCSAAEPGAVCRELLLALGYQQ